mgnify:FL=1
MRLDRVCISGRWIGDGFPCFVIAEAGVAHFGSIEKAIKLVDLAVASQADAVKFQIFDVDSLISREAQDWKDRLGSRCLTIVEFDYLKQYCLDSGIIFLATPHDKYGLDALRELDVAAFKIGSGERKNWSFLQEIARCGKPIIFSTGMYSIEDVRQALRIFEETGNDQIAMLHCTTMYPTPPSEVNLRTLLDYKRSLEA